MRAAPLLLVTGTGTGIGKTHVAEALLHHWGRSLPVIGIKPVETGVAPRALGEDAARLRAASTFHVKPWPQAPFVFERPVSPHLAARDEKTRITFAPILAMVRRVRASAAGVLVELPGGLFSPLGPRLLNVDLAARLGADALVLVAPDRLGVLHDVAAATRACAIPITGILLVAPAAPDTSTGTNANELRVVTDVPVLGTVPRAAAADLADHEAIAAAVAAITFRRRSVRDPATASRRRSDPRSRRRA